MYFIINFHNEVLVDKYIIILWIQIIMLKIRDKFIVNWAGFLKMDSRFIHVIAVPHYVYEWLDGTFYIIISFK